MKKHVVGKLVNNGDVIDDQIWQEMVSYTYLCNKDHFKMEFRRLQCDVTHVVFIV